MVFGVAAALTAIISNWSWQIFTRLLREPPLVVTVDLNPTHFVPAIDDIDAMGNVQFRPIYTVTNNSDRPFVIETISFESREPSTYWATESGDDIFLCSKLSPAILTSRGLNDEGSYDPLVLAPIPIVIGPNEAKIIVPNFFLGLAGDCRNGPAVAGTPVQLTQEIIVADLTPSLFGRRARWDSDVPFSCEDMTDYDLVFRLANGRREVVKMRHYITTDRDSWASSDYLMVCPGQTNVPGDVMDRLLTQQAVQREREELAAALSPVEPSQPAAQ